MPLCAHRLALSIGFGYDPLDRLTSATYNSTGTLLGTKLYSAFAGTVVAGHPRTRQQKRLSGSNASAFLPVFSARPNSFTPSQSPGVPNAL